MNICIYGAASPQLDQIYYEKTEELGRLMAKFFGFLIINLIQLWAGSDLL